MSNWINTGKTHKQMSYYSYGGMSMHVPVATQFGSEESSPILPVQQAAAGTTGSQTMVETQQPGKIQPLLQMFLHGYQVMNINAIQ